MGGIASYDSKKCYNKIMSVEFQKIPFYMPDTGIAQHHDLRLYRPVLSSDGSPALDMFHAHVAETLTAAGFSPDDVTLQLPDRYEVTIVSKGSINRATTLTDDTFFASVHTESIHDVLLDELPGTSKRPIPATLGKISYYGTELGEKTKVPRYLAAFLDMDGESIAKYVGLERFAGYEWLKAYSGLDKEFTMKLRTLKPAAFRFAAFHDLKHLPEKALVEKLIPPFPVKVILGRVAAAGFDDTSQRA